MSSVDRYFSMLYSIALISDKIILAAVSTLRSASSSTLVFLSLYHFSLIIELVVVLKQTIFGLPSISAKIHPVFVSINKFLV